MKYNHLTVIKDLNKSTPDKHRLFLFKCDCGKEKEIMFSRVKQGYTKTCGTSCPYTVKHGYCRQGKSVKIYYTWSNMLKRTNQDKNSRNYKWYKGIKTCKRWHKFENFLKDMGEPISPDLSIDRIDNSKGYSKNNCRWATINQQANNKKNTRLFTYKGQIKTLRDWSNITNVKYSTLLIRINKYGWSVNRALSTPKLTTWSRHKTK